MQFELRSQLRSQQRSQQTIQDHNQFLGLFAAGQNNVVLQDPSETKECTEILVGAENQLPADPESNSNNLVGETNSQPLGTCEPGIDTLRTETCNGTVSSLH